MRLSGPLATVIAAIIAVAGMVIGAFLNPWAEKLVNRPASGPPASGPLAIEQLPREVAAFDSSDDDPSNGAAAEFRLVYDLALIPRYDFIYDLPEGRQASAGLQIQFVNGLDVSAYRSLDFTIQFGQMGQGLDLTLFDIDGTKQAIHINSDGIEPAARSYGLDAFAPVNLRALRAISFFTQTDYNTGHHGVSIQKIQFVK